MSTVRFGNNNPQMQVPRARLDADGHAIVDADGAPVIDLVSVKAPHLNQAVTTIEYDAHALDDEHVELALSTSNDQALTRIARLLGKANRKYAVAVQQFDQIVDAHAQGEPPAWIDGDDDELVAALAAFYDVPAGEPTALLTNLGRDNLHAQHLGTAAQPAACNYMGLTANATAESASNTSLTAEITTAGGGLIRKQGTYAHTGGTNTSTITATFTVNGTDAIPVTIAKDGLFNHITTAATMCYEKLISATATLNAIGDSVTITHTITGG